MKYNLPYGKISSEMISPLKYDNYREFLKDWIRDHPSGGHGVKGKLAKRLGVSSTLISFVLSGKKKLTLEQASDLMDHLKLSDFEGEYLFLLVEIERSGTHRLTAKLEKKRSQMQQQGQKIANRVKSERVLPDQALATYYSSWLYTGIRNLIATREFRTASELASRLEVNEQLVSSALRFLLDHSLCVEEKGVLRTGPVYTHLDADSPFVDQHRQNWRVRSIVKMQGRSPQDLFYSSPMSMSRADVARVRALLLELIEKTVAIMRPSASEEAVCLNIDWFRY